MSSESARTPRDLFPSPTPRNLFVGPLGDAVMAVPVTRELRKWGYRGTLGMPAHLAQMFRDFDLSGNARAPVSDAHELGDAVNVVAYLKRRPHTRNVPLVTEIGRHVSQELGIPSVNVNPEDVWFSVTNDDVKQGRLFLNTALNRALTLKREKPIVLFHPSAGSANREIPATTLQNTIKLLEDKIRPVFIGGKPKGAGYESTEFLKTSLSELVQILAAADAVVSAESGPLHLAAAIAQYQMQNEDVLDRAITPNRIIGVFGSSNPVCSYYPGMRLVLASRMSCRMANGCGFHGYAKHDPDLVEAYYPDHAVYYHKDNSACIDPKYAERSIAPCMESIEPEDIANTIRNAVE